MSINRETLDRITHFYDKTLERSGASPLGVDFNSLHAQQERFRQLLKIVEAPGSWSLVDYGCGYGELLNYLKATSFPCSRFIGYDLTPSMIDVANTLFAGDRNATFTASRSDVPPSDYVVGSGLFNIRFMEDTTAWMQHIEATIDDMAAIAVNGFSFNMLTMYSDQERMRSDLYYGDPHYYFNYCRKFSRHVALLHDYEFYDFTILVRKVLPKLREPA